MDCKYKDSLVPRCEIVTHPDRPNVEYCKLCREWDYLDHIGGVFPPGAANIWWFIVAAGLMMFVLRANSLQESSSYDNDLPPAQSARGIGNGCLSRYCNN